MCGIAGIISKSDETETINKMGLSMLHRGPDSQGKFIDREKGIFLSHNRLAILDTSSNGSQPMISNDANLIIIFNGEIYNHLDIREKIKENSNKNFNWRGTSDTETLLEAISLFGLDMALQYCRGMFAFALYNKLNQTVTLARDVCGEKPLYYGFINKKFVFASEIKAITQVPFFEKKINEKSINLYFQFNFIPEPFSIFQNIYKLEKSTYLVFSINNNNIFKKYKYYDFESQKNHNKSPESHLHNLLQKSVQEQMISDVPIGTFLSGGIDSSLITALCKDLSKNKVDTFNISYENKEFDESLYAKKIAKHLNTNHYDIRFDASSAKKIIPDLGKVYCEPFADRSQLPMIFLSQYTSNFKKVVLSGDGADELFAGYNRHINAKKIMLINKFLPLSIRKSLSLISNNNIQFLYKILSNINFIGESYGKKMSDNQISKIKSVISSNNLKDYYFKAISNNNYKLSKNKFEENLNLFKEIINIDKFSLNNLINYDYLFYLPNDVLQKVDRASMSSSIESRAPFLSIDIKNFSNSLKENQLINKNNGKVILRNILKKYLPQNLIERPKMGFDLPLSQWSQAELKYIFLDYLNSKKIFDYIDVNKVEINNLIKDFEKNRHQNFNRIWNFISLQIWFETYF
jgi:asparagine synthase (glutamine-hydrolysing)